MSSSQSSVSSTSSKSRAPVLIANRGEIAIRIARLGVQVRRDQLIIRGFFRTRTFNASQISGITLARGHYQQFGSFWVPYVHLRGSGSIRLAGLMTGGTRAGPPATLVALTQEIASLLGVQMRS